MNGKLRNMTSIYLYDDEGMWLLYRVGSRVISDSYTGTAGGHFEPEELNDAKACVLRELYEETGLREADIKDLALRYITLRLKNGEVRQNYYFFARLAGENRPEHSSEGALRYFPYSELPALDMPFSAKYVILHWPSGGRYTSQLYGGVSERDGIRFAVMEEFD